MIEANLVARLNYSLLNIGAWTDVPLGAITNNNGDLSCLVPHCDTGYTNGQVWQSARQNWVYETEVMYTDMDMNVHSPKAPEIYVNGGLVTTGFTINYPLGRVIFDPAISETDQVQACFSFKNIGVIMGDQTPWWTEIQRRSWNIDEKFFTKTPECNFQWMVDARHLLQMPVIVVTGVPTGQMRGLAIGNCKKRYDQDILIHILSEKKPILKTLMDVIFSLGDRNLCTFECDDAAIAGDLPLDCGGVPTGMLTLPELVDQYPWCRLETGVVQLIELHSLKCGLFEAMLRIPTSIVVCATC